MLVVLIRSPRPNPEALVIVTGPELPVARLAHRDRGCAVGAAGAGDRGTSSSRPNTAPCHAPVEAARCSVKIVASPRNSLAYVSAMAICGYEILDARTRFIAHF